MAQKCNAPTQGLALSIMLAVLNCKMGQVYAFVGAATFSICIQSCSFAKELLPIGGAMEYVNDSSSRTVTTPGGENVRVELSSYDRWWLSKTEAEQAAWRDFWLTQVESASKDMNPSYTFVMFMKSVQKNQLSATDFGLTYEGISGKDSGPPEYAVEIARLRCENYRKGMSFDEGRDRVAQVLSRPSKIAAARDLMLGTSNSQPTVIGAILMAANVTRALEAECPTEAARARSNGSQFD